VAKFFITVSLLLNRHGYDDAVKLRTATMIDHDQLFKELLSTFFIEFLELFFPQIAAAIDPDSVSFLPQEYFADLTTGEIKSLTCSLRCGWLVKKWAS
jgi:hypothetical protein